MKLKLKLACLICLFAIPVILLSCKESIEVEEIASPKLNESTKPSDEEIEDFKNWYSNLENSPNARVGTKDGMDEIQEVELWKKAVSHKQSNSTNKLLTVPLLDFKDKKQTKLRKLCLTETNGIKNGFKMDIKSSNGKNDKFTGTVTIMSLDEKSQREYKYKDNKLESKKNSRMADFGNQNLPEVTVTAYVNHGGTMLLVTLMFSPTSMIPSYTLEMAEPCGNDGCGYVNMDYDPALVEAMIDWLRDKLLAEASKYLNPTEMAILRTMSTSNIVRFYANIIAAKNWTEDRFGLNTNNDPNQHANAFKHAYLAALQTKSFGQNISSQLMMAHELGQPNACDSAMDVLNNEIGINLGLTFNGSNYDLVNQIYNMARNGQLWSVGGNCILHQVPF